MRAVIWAVIVPALLGVLLGVGAGANAGKVPRPAPFSCASLAAVAPDGQIAPVCGEQVTP